MGMGTGSLANTVIGAKGNLILQKPSPFPIRRSSLGSSLGPALGQNLGQIGRQDLDPNTNKVDQMEHMELCDHDEAFTTEEQTNIEGAQGGKPASPAQEEEDYDVQLEILAKQTEAVTAKQEQIRREKRDKNKAANADALSTKKTNKNEFKSGK